MTVGCISIYAAAFIGYRLAKNKEVDVITGTLVSLFCFFIVVPLSETGGLNMTYMGSQGLFTAMITSLVSVSMYAALMKTGKLTIKLPDSVPEVVSKSFAGLFPSIITAFVFIFVAYAFTFTGYDSLANLIYTVVGTPLYKLSSSVWSLVIVCLIMQLFWFFGVHGTMIVMPIMSVLFTPLSAENIAMSAAGVANAELHILDSGFFRAFVGIGGTGGTISLLLLVLLFGKSRRYKMITKISFVPSLFSINEPVVFGYPIVLNPILAIPFILTPAIQALIGWLLISISLFPHPTGAWAPFGTPLLINSIPVLGFSGPILQIILILVGMAIYFPFFKVLDNQALKEEQNTTTE